MEVRLNLPITPTQRSRPTNIGPTPSTPSTAGSARTWSKRNTARLEKKRKITAVLNYLGIVIALSFGIWLFVRTSSEGLTSWFQYTKGHDAFQRHVARKQSRPKLGSKVFTMHETDAYNMGNKNIVFGRPRPVNSEILNSANLLQVRNACAIYHRESKSFVPLFFARGNVFTMDMESQNLTAIHLAVRSAERAWNAVSDNAAWKVDESASPRQLQLLSNSILQALELARAPPLPQQEWDRSAVPFIQGSTIFSVVKADSSPLEWRKTLEYQAFAYLNQASRVDDDLIPGINNVFFSTLCNLLASIEGSKALLFNRLRISIGRFSSETQNVLLSTLSDDTQILGVPCLSSGGSAAQPICFEELIIPIQSGPKLDPNVDAADSKPALVYQDDPWRALVRTNYILDPFRRAAYDLFSLPSPLSACQYMSQNRQLNILFVKWNEHSKDEPVTNAQEIESWFVNSEISLFDAQVELKITTIEFWPSSQVEEIELLSRTHIFIIPEGEHESRLLYLPKDAVVIKLSPDCPLAENHRFSSTSMADKYILHESTFDGAEFVQGLRLRFFPIHTCSRHPKCHEDNSRCGLKVKRSHMMAAFRLLTNPDLPASSDLIYEDRLHSGPQTKYCRYGYCYTDASYGNWKPEPSKLTRWCESEAGQFDGNQK